MNIEDYQIEAQNTKSDMFIYPIPHGPGSTSNSAHIDTDVLHAIIGCSTEAGEMLDVVKKAMFYGKSVDYINLDEEMGDTLWYIAIYCTARGTTIEALCEKNNRKLKTRFPDKFKATNAINRNLTAERKELEK